MASSFNNSDLEVRFKKFLLQIPQNILKPSHIMEIAFRFDIDHGHVKIWFEDYPSDIRAVIFELIGAILKRMRNKTVQQKIFAFVSACDGNSFMNVERLLEQCNISPSDWKQ